MITPDNEYCVDNQPEIFESSVADKARQLNNLLEVMFQMLDCHDDIDGDLQKARSWDCLVGVYKRYKEVSEDCIKRFERRTHNETQMQNMR